MRKIRTITSKALLFVSSVFFLARAEDDVIPLTVDIVPASGTVSMPQYDFAIKFIFSEAVKLSEAGMSNEDSIIIRQGVNEKLKYSCVNLENIKIASGPDSREVMIYVTEGLDATLMHTVFLPLTCFES